MKGPGWGWELLLFKRIVLRDRSIHFWDVLILCCGSSSHYLVLSKLLCWTLQLQVGTFGLHNMQIQDFYDNLDWSYLTLWLFRVIGSFHDFFWACLKLWLWGNKIRVLHCRFIFLCRSYRLDFSILWAPDMHNWGLQIFV